MIDGCAGRATHIGSDTLVNSETTRPENASAGAGSLLKWCDQVNAGARGT